MSSGKFKVGVANIKDGCFAEWVRWLFSLRTIAVAMGVCAAFLLLIQCACSVSQWSVEPADLHAYRMAAVKVGAGMDPYIASNNSRVLQYLYPPTFVLLAGPVLQIPGTRGLALWAAFQMAVLVCLILCIRAAVIRAGISQERVMMAMVLLLFAPAWRNMVEGQVSSLAITLLFAGGLLAEKERYLVAGLLLAMAAHLKVLPLVAFLVLLVQWRWKVAMSMAVAGLLLIPLSGIWLAVAQGAEQGWGSTGQLWLSWFTNMVQPVVTHPDNWVTLEFTPWNHSLNATLYRLFNSEQATMSGAMAASSYGWQRAGAWLLGGAGVVLGLLLAARGRWLAEVRMASFGFVLIMVNLAHAQTWTHHLLAFSLLAPLLGDNDRQTRLARKVAWVAIAIFAIVFTLPAVLVFLLPTEMGNKQYALLFDAGRYSIPTISIVLVWCSTFCIAWIKSRPLSILMRLPGGANSAPNRSYAPEPDRAYSHN